MNEINAANGMDMNAFLDEVMAEAKRETSEEQRISSARIQVHSEKIQDKRREQLENLLEQTKEAAPGGCFRFFRSTFKIFDLLLKPLSVLTAGKLKLELGSALEKLQEAKELQHQTGLQMNEGKISKILTDLKRLLQDDFQKMEARNQTDHRETQKIMKMIEEIHDGFRNVSQP